MKKNNFITELSKGCSNIAKYFHTLWMKREEQLKPKYRVVQYEYTNGQTYCKIQMIKTRFVADYTAATIMADDDLTNGFTPLNVRMICNLANFDLYSRSKNYADVAHIVVSDNYLNVTYANNQILQYDINSEIDINTIKSPRVSYMLGCMKTEQLMKDSVQNPKYRIIRDNDTTLEILDTELNKSAIYTPQELLFSEKCTQFSKKDIIKIGYMCGQMSLLTK